MFFSKMAEANEQFSVALPFPPQDMTSPKGGHCNPHVLMLAKHPNIKHEPEWQVGQTI